VVTPVHILETPIRLSFNSS